MALTPEQILALQQQAEQLELTITRLSSSMDRLDFSTQLGKTFEAFSTATDQVAALERAIASATGPTPELDAALAQVKGSIAALAGESNAAAEEMASLIDAAGGISAIDSSQLDEMADKVGTLTDEMTKGYKRGEDLRQSLLGLSGSSAKLSAMLPKSAAGFKGMGKSMFSAKTIGAGFSKVAGEIINQTLALAQAQDAAISSFRKATGATAEYNRGIVATERRNFAAGVSAGDAGKAFEALFQGFSAFTQLNENQQAAVADTTSLLAELGVSAQTTAKLFDTGMRSLSMSAGASNAMILDLVGSAQTLGVSMDKMTSDFMGAIPELSKYGDGAIDVFKGLAVQAKNTGLEVGQLLQITKQFDQFDSAGKAVGRLNAILGGPYLNSIDMLNATEEERIALLKQSVDMAGVQFDALGRYEKQAIASSLGMSVDEANRLFSMSQEQYQLDAMKQKELKELATESQEIMDQLKNAMMGLAINMRPLIENVVVPLVKGFGKLAQWIGTGTNALAQFAKVGMLAAGIAALVAAPFTGGMSLGAYAAIVGGAGAIGGAFGAMGASSGTTKSAQVTPRFADGGTITTEQAALHPDELLITGGQGSQVISAQEFKELIDILKKQKEGATTGPIHLAVYIGQDKVDDFVVKSLKSPAVAKVLSPYAARTA